MKISILLIATKRYKELVQPLIDSINKYFLSSYEIKIHLFTDDVYSPQYYSTERVTITKYQIPSYGYPAATLFRYDVFTAMRSTEYNDFIFYLDVDMKIVKEISIEILCDLLAVRHPGYFNGGGTWETETKSASFVPEEKRLKYFAGGFQGGRKEIYYKAMRLMRKWIYRDVKKNIKPIWDDESAWNKLLTTGVSFKEFSPEYCMPEPVKKRIAWGINHFEPKILALEKPKDFRA